MFEHTIVKCVINQDKGVVDSAVASACLGRSSRSQKPSDTNTAMWPAAEAFPTIGRRSMLILTPLGNTVDTLVMPDQTRIRQAADR